MKIKTITCHDVYNYGASLQAYALMTYLSTLGHDVEIIDYKPEYLCHHYEFGYVTENHRYYKLCQSSILFKFLYGIRLLPVTFGTWRRIKPFKRFKQEMLHCTRTYKSYDDLVKNPPEADMLIAGSDQIWNCKLPNGRDPAFFLRFGLDSTKRISYAASFSLSNIPVECVNTMRINLSGLDAISCREETGVRILMGLGLKGCTVPDPVFLLSNSQWLSFSGEKRRIKEKYILVYSLYRNNKIIKDAALNLAKDTHLPIVSLNASSKVDYANTNIADAGPKEFVNLIAHAEYLLTDSFHGTAFSVIMNVPFNTYYTSRGISRIKDLLSILNLENHLNSRDPKFVIDWESVNRNLNSFINVGKDFLNNHLSNE